MIRRNTLELIFTAKTYLLEYLRVMEAKGYDNGLYTWALRRTYWASGHKICVFKVKAPPIAGLQPKQRNGELRREMKFAAPLSANVTVLLLSE